MSEFDPTRPPPEAPTPIRQREISRNQAKWIEGRLKSAVDQMSGREERLRKAMQDDVDNLSQALHEARANNARYKAILEAVCRRHGTLVFDKASMAAQCMRGRVEVLFDQLRITVQLIPDLEVIEAEPQQDTSVIDIGEAT